MKKNPEIELESLVMEQYGRQILETIQEILKEHQVNHAKLRFVTGVLWNMP